MQRLKTRLNRLASKASQNENPKERIGCLDFWQNRRSLALGHGDPGRWGQGFVLQLLILQL